jgi:DNA-binding transcriptional MerR regulator
MEVYTPAQAAEILKVASATLRRMARSYERSYEQLPRNERGDRLWPADAIDRLQAAKALRERGHASSLEAGLEMLATGGEEPGEVLEWATAPKPWEVVVVQLQALREAMGRLEVENRIIKDQLRALPGAQEDVEALKKRNAYLEGELRRRDEQPQTGRPWWRVWGK